MAIVTLPTRDGALAPFTTSPPRRFARAALPFPRVVYAAAHVVVDPLGP